MQPKRQFSLLGCYLGLRHPESGPLTDGLSETNVTLANGHLDGAQTTGCHLVSGPVIGSWLPHDNDSTTQTTLSRPMEGNKIRPS